MELAEATFEEIVDELHNRSQQDMCSVVVGILKNPTGGHDIDDGHVILNQSGCPFACTGMIRALQIGTDTLINPLPEFLEDMDEEETDDDVREL